VSDPCSTATAEVWGAAAGKLLLHLTATATNESGWSQALSCPSTGVAWVEDYPFGEMQGGGPARLRRLPLAPQCRCAEVGRIAGVSGVVYSREHLTWVRYLGDDRDLFACNDRHAYWESAQDPTVADRAAGWYAARVWYSAVVTSDPVLSPSLARPI